MIKLDRAGLDYLIECAADIGFVATKWSTYEEDGQAPTINLTFRQTPMSKPADPETEQPAKEEPTLIPPKKTETLDD